MVGGEGSMNGFTKFLFLFFIWSGLGCGPLATGASDAGWIIDGQIATDSGPAADRVSPRDATVGQDTKPPPQEDGTPTRRACTNDFGSALTEEHGRLDGILVAIVAPTQHSCNADNNHLHLQVKSGNQIYDVAVTLASAEGVEDVNSTTWDGDLQSGAWSEGWHAGANLNYVALGLRSREFAPRTKDQLVDDITAELATANHISIFGTGYGPDGMHLVHRKNGLDGAIVIRPLSALPHYLVFKFADNYF
jgi:hypothetical protein